MGDGDVHRVVLQVGLAVVVVAQVHLVVEHRVEEGAHGQALLPQGFAADERDLLHLVAGGGAEFLELLFGFRDLPDADHRFIFKFLLKI